MRLEQAGHAACLGLVEQRREQLRRVGFFRDDEHIDATATGVEHVARSFAGDIDICHQGRPGHTDAQLTHAFEVRASIDIQIEDDNIDRPALARTGQRSPILARHEAIPITRGGT